MPREESPAEALDSYAFDYGTEYYDDGYDSGYGCCPCCDGTCDCCVGDVEKLCAEDAPEPPSTFANRPRQRRS